MCVYRYEQINNLVNPWHSTAISRCISLATSVAAFVKYCSFRNVELIPFSFIQR